jgi:aryl-alcohol dehydrogenase-like predicted oxidoreductase
MLFTAFPQTSLKPSVLCLGTGAFGSDVSVDDSFAMLDAFAEAGGNFADSAHIYAAWLPDGAGKSERTLGQWIASRKPDNFLVGTKGAHPHLETMDVPRPTPGCIARDLDESLQRLRLDTVDLYWLHRDDPQIPVDEVIDALNEHIAAGRIRALGASNWSVARIEEANRQASRKKVAGFCASQIGWSLAEVNKQVRGAGGTVAMDDQIMQWHRASGLPVAAYSAQAYGFFAHPLPVEGAELTPKQKSLAPSYLSLKNQMRYARAEELGRRLGRTAHEVALAYLWNQSFPSVAIIGPRSLKQLRGSLNAADLQLSADDISLLETPLDQDK